MPGKLLVMRALYLGPIQGALSAEIILHMLNRHLHARTRTHTKIGPKMQAGKKKEKKEKEGKKVITDDVWCPVTSHAASQPPSPAITLKF